MTTRGFCACFHCGDGAPMPVAKAVAKAVAAERARCAAVCREVAAREAGYRNLVARDAAETCAEAIERKAVTP